MTQEDARAVLLQRLDEELTHENGHAHLRPTSPT